MDTEMEAIYVQLLLSDLRVVYDGEPAGGRVLRVHRIEDARAQGIHYTITMYTTVAPLFSYQVCRHCPELTMRSPLLPKGELLRILLEDIKGYARTRVLREERN